MSSEPNSEAMTLAFDPEQCVGQGVAAGGRCLEM